MSPSRGPEAGARSAQIQQDAARTGAVRASLPLRNKDTSRDVAPLLVHRMQHNASILALALSSERIFAGTEKGQILVCLTVLVST